MRNQYFVQVAPQCRKRNQRWRHNAGNVISGDTYAREIQSQEPDKYQNIDNNPDNPPNVYLQLH